MGSLGKGLALVLILIVAISTLSPIFIKPTTANSEGYIPNLSMPEEYVNYTITELNGTLWAIIDGYYPIYLQGNFTGDLPIVYPVPPNTTNISVSLNDEQINWSNLAEYYPWELHHTAFGDWGMISSNIRTASNNFELRIHYEHPLQEVNGSYIFLYDLNVSPYLSEQSPNTTAYFNIQMSTNFTDLRVYNTETDTKWNPAIYNLTKTNSSQIISIEQFSEFGKPLLGDLVVAFSFNRQLPEFPSVLAIVLLITAMFASGLVLRTKKYRLFLDCARIYLISNHSRIFCPRSAFACSSFLVGGSAPMKRHIAKM